ncbi:MAG: hypothetical protein WCP21_01605 [Armatimonadota bacterium]
MLVATFASSSALGGKHVTYDNEDEQFRLEDALPVSPQQVQEFDDNGELEWAYDGLREWLRQLASGAPETTPLDCESSPEAQVAVTAAPPAASKRSPRSRRSLVWIIVTTVVAVLALIVAIPILTSSGKKTPATAQTPSPSLVAENPSAVADNPSVGLPGFTAVEDEYWANTHETYREMTALQLADIPLLPKWQSLSEAKRNVVRTDFAAIAGYYATWKNQLPPSSRWKHAHAVWISWLRDWADGTTTGLKGLEMSLTEGASQRATSLAAQGATTLRRTDRTLATLLHEWSRLKKQSAQIEALSATASAAAAASAPADDSSSSGDSSYSYQPALADRVTSDLNVRADYTSFDIPTPTIRVAGPAYGGGKIVEITYYVSGDSILDENALVDGVSPATVDVMAGAFSEPDVSIVDVTWKTDFTDAYGNSSREAAMQIRWKRKTFKKVNIDGLWSRTATSPEVLYMISDWYSINPAIWNATHLKHEIPMIGGI